MSDAGEPRDPKSVAPASVCCACGKDLALGAGRFLLQAGAVCVECYDAGRRGPPATTADG
jgi:hypothetical protein